MTLFKITSTLSEECLKPQRFPGHYDRARREPRSWYGLPVEVRQRWLSDTGFGARPPSEEMRQVLAEHGLAVEKIGNRAWRIEFKQTT